MDLILQNLFCCQY